jgi:L,D-transpeptidase-like protein
MLTGRIPAALVPAVLLSADGPRVDRISGRRDRGHIARHNASQRRDSGLLGGPLVFGVVGVRGRWVEVTAEALPNGQYGWVEFGRDVSVQSVQWELRASLSRRELEVVRDGRLMRTIPVGIGAAGSPTPTGRFAVAEKVTGPFGPAYGCCILALTARQPRLPPGWNTNITYYVAIHAGSGQGSAVSAGCLHATEADVRYLMRTIPLGTAVRILR